MKVESVTTNYELRVRTIRFPLHHGLMISIQPTGLQHHLIRKSLTLIPRRSQEISLNGLNFRSAGLGLGAVLVGGSKGSLRWAGHNKWSKIKHKKGAKDLNKTKLFSKATKAIRVASSACGGDVDNLHLQSAIQAARALQVPKDRIEDAIKNVKSASSSASSGTAEVISQRYDGQVVTASGKVAVIAIALTDNKNRTAANLRNIFKKANGDLLNTGSNSFFFDHLGVLLVKKYKREEHSNEQEEDEENTSHGNGNLSSEVVSEELQEQLMDCALENGAIDIDFGSDTDEHILLKCEPTDLFPLATAIKNHGYSLGEFESAYLVKDESDGGTTIQLDMESTDHFEDFLQKMDNDDDISVVYHNANLMEQ